MTTITHVVKRTLASPKAQEQLLRMALLVLIWLWAFSIRLVRWRWRSRPLEMGVLPLGSVGAGTCPLLLH